jgi:signal transduction histidine kinase
MIDNLVGNAVRHAGREDVTVTILCRVHDDGLTIEVADDGRGIDPEDRERIFGLFQRGRSTASKGSGVGLGMVRRIAQASGGTLTLADSERGAVFVIRLPGDVVVEPPTAAPAADDPSPAGEVAPTPG